MCYVGDVNGSCPQCPECSGRRETILVLDVCKKQCFSIQCILPSGQDTKSLSMFAVEKHKTAFQQMDVTGVDTR